MVILGLFGLVAVLAWIDYKKSVSKPKHKPDYVTRSILLSAFIIAVLLLCEGLGIINPGWSREHWWVYAGIVISIFLLNFWSMIKKSPIKFERLKMIALDHIKEQFNAEPYKGEAELPCLDWYKITENRRGLGGVDSGLLDAVGNFLLTVKGAVVFPVLISLNIYTGVVLYIQHHPPQPLVNNLLGSEVGRSYDAWLVEAQEQKGEVVSGENAPD